MKIINIMAASLDGRIAAQTIENSEERKKFGLSNEDDQAFLRSELRQADAVILGSRSILADGQLIEGINDKGQQALWVLFTTKGLPATLPFWRQTHIPRILVSPQPLNPVPKLDKTPGAGAPVNWTYGQQHPARFVYEKLQDIGIERVLLFGGGQINALFYEQKLVSELKLTLAPILVGKDTPFFVQPELSSERRFKLLSVDARSSFVYLHYEVID
ncbi:MAG: dihydrofolate reductase family protein [Oligoflexales bacterium]|nr:dihydrofolate reductase family protein [Oligoflexales bacterium]